jgi:hypothetical protein
MKKLLLALLVVIPSMTIAKENDGDFYSKSVQCFPTKILLYTIDTQFKESAVFFYSNEITKRKTQIVMFSNKETGSWTLIEMDKSLGCVLAVGQNTLS